MNFASKSVIHENPLGSFTCRKAGTWDIFYFPSEGRHTEDFPDARKIQRLRPALNSRTRVPVASMLTTRPPKPSSSDKQNPVFQFTPLIRLNADICQYFEEPDASIYREMRAVDSSKVLLPVNRITQCCPQRPEY